MSNTLGYVVLDKIDEDLYIPENAEEDDRPYTGKDFIEMARGNLKYAESLYERMTWQHPETFIEEDFMYDEIVEFNNQIIMTGGDPDFTERLRSLIEK